MRHSAGSMKQWCKLACVDRKVIKALRQVKKHKDPYLSAVVAKMWQATAQLEISGYMNSVVIFLAVVINDLHKYI